MASWNLTGRTLGSYQILEEVGRGGMAIVYRAYQPSLNRHVAVKVLPPHLAYEPEFIQRFVREARAAARLRHPNIVVVYDVAEQEGLHYITMEYLEGQTLRDLIERQGSLPSARAARITRQIAAALDYAHQHGLVHRDVKPSNIFVGRDDHVTLTDFGIAKAGTETQHLTRTGTLVGTPEYMSPEQASGGAVDGRTDLYSLGVVLYQMITGRVPFSSTTPHATLHAVIYEPPLPPRQLNPRIPPAVEEVLLKALAKRPEDRFQTGQSLAQAFDQARTATAAKLGTPSAGVARPAAGQAVLREHRPTKRRPVRALAMGAGLTALLLIVATAVLLLLAIGSDGEGSGVKATTAVGAAAGTSVAEQVTSAAAPTLVLGPEPAEATGTAQAQEAMLAATAQEAERRATQTAIPLLTADALVQQEGAAAATQTAAVLEGTLQALVATQTSVAAEATGAAISAGQTAAAALAAEQARETANAQGTDQALAAGTARALETATAQAQGATGTAVAQQTAAAQARATAAAQTATARAIAQQQPGLLVDFETDRTWRRGDQPFGELTRSTEQVKAGSYAGRLRYDFQAVSDNYVVFEARPAIPIGGRATGIRAWVYGDGSGHFLNAWIQDSASEVRAYTFGRIQHTGWQLMTAWFDEGRGWPNGHISGPDNGQLDYPVRFQALVLDGVPDGRASSGVIYLDEIVVTDEPLP
jgi:tRNA A-37 threonylcarbamoyl transferase component Bud32